MIKIQKCKTTISITAKNFLNRKQSQRKQFDWLKFKKQKDLLPLEAGVDKQWI